MMDWFSSDSMVPIGFYFHFENMLPILILNKYWIIYFEIFFKHFNNTVSHLRAQLRTHLNNIIIERALYLDTRLQSTMKIKSYRYHTITWKPIHHLLDREPFADALCLTILFLPEYLGNGYDVMRECDKRWCHTFEDQAVHRIIEKWYL